MKEWETEWLEQLNDLINLNLANDALSNEFLAKSLSMSVSSFYRRVNRLTKQTPNLYIRKIRLEKAYVLIKEGKKETIKEVVSIVGFRKYNYFSSLFKEHFGILPSELLK